MGQPYTSVTRRRLSIAGFVLICGWLLAAAPPSAVNSSVGTYTLHFPLVSGPPLRMLAFSGNGDLFTIYEDGSGGVQLTATQDADESEPDWSPDGTQIAFTRSVWEPGPLGKSLRSHIYVMNADGSGDHKLVDLMGSNAPAWSPDGSKIAFQGFRSLDINGAMADPAIFVVAADGTGLQQLAAFPDTGGRPVWSPDGSMIAVGPASASRVLLRLMRADGSQERTFWGLPQSYQMPVWSPDSTRLIYSDTSRTVAIEHVDGTPPVIVRQRVGYPGEAYGNFQWSADGGRIYFSLSYLDASATVHRIGSFLLQPDGIYEVRFGFMDATDLRLSPDGRRILVSEHTTINVVHADALGMPSIPHTFIAEGIFPRWQP